MKGQITAIDALIAVLLFAGIYSMLNVQLSNIETQGDDFDFLSTRVDMAAAHLLTSTGEPVNWSPSNVSQLGLVVNRGVVERDKLGNFLNLSQTNLNTTRNLLGISGLRFYFNVSYVNGTNVTINSSNFNGTAIAGQDFSTSPAASIRSLAVYNGSRVFVNIKIGT